jgi:hypothetical protein
VSTAVTVECADPAARCGFETVQPDFDALAALLHTLDRACADAPQQCGVILDRIDTDAAGDKHARIRLLAAGELLSPLRAAPTGEVFAATDTPTASD